MLHVLVYKSKKENNTFVRITMSLDVLIVLSVSYLVHITQVSFFITTRNEVTTICFNIVEEVAISTSSTTWNLF